MRILVLSLSGIGDTLIATPFLHELRENFPQAQIDVLVLWKGSADLLQGNPHIDRVWQKNLIRDGAWKSLPFLLKLRRQRYDLSVNVHPQGRVEYRMVARFIGAKLRVSVSYENHGWFDRLLIHRQIPQDYTVHSIENNRRLLALIGAKRTLAIPRYELFLSDEERAWASRFLEENHLVDRTIVGFHVGSGGTKNLALRRWPTRYYGELINSMARDRPETAFLLFGGTEENVAHSEISDMVRSPHVFFPASANVRQAAALIAECDVFVSVDTALMHVAAAVEVDKQLVIETPTLNPPVFPARDKFVLVPNPAVAGRHLDYYRYDGGPIRGTDAEITALMNSVTVDAVRTAVDQALA